MHDEAGMRMRHRAGHLHDEADAFTQGQLARACIRVNGQAGDIFQREERPAVGGDAGVVKPRNVRVGQRRQDVAFAGHAVGE